MNMGPQESCPLTIWLTNCHAHWSCISWKISGPSCVPEGLNTCGFIAPLRWRAQHRWCPINHCRWPLGWHGVKSVCFGTAFFYRLLTWAQGESHTCPTLVLHKRKNLKAGRALNGFCSCSCLDNTAKLQRSMSAHWKQSILHQYWLEGSPSHWENQYPPTQARGRGCKLWINKNNQ